MAPVLGYWDIRGLGETIRYLLHYLGIEFEDKRYEFGPEPNYTDSEWTRTDKHKLELEFPNIPYYIDGDVKLTQSNAIIRYLARQHPDQLYFPETGKEVITFEIVDGHVRDLGLHLAFLAYNPEYEKFKPLVVDKVKGQIKPVADFQDGKEWLFGDKISPVDFLLYESLDRLDMCFPGCYGDHENLVKFMERFRSLRGVETYLKTSRKWPLYMPYAYWGGKGDKPQ